MDKIRTKQVWLALGLPTPRYVRLAPGDDVHAAARELGLPVIVKPSLRRLQRRRVAACSTTPTSRPPSSSPRAIRGELLMEQLIDGDELTVPVLLIGGEHVALPSIRIVPKGEWYDYHAKYVADDTQYLCPGLEGADEAEIRRLARAAFARARLPAAGAASTSCATAPAGKFYLLEVNTAPGMTSHSLVPKAARQVGIEFEELCWRDPRTSLARSPEVRGVNAMLRLVALVARAGAGRAAGRGRAQRLDRRRAAGR